MSLILILSDDFVFSEAITLLLAEVRSDSVNLNNKGVGVQCRQVMFKDDINHLLAVNQCSSLIVDIQGIVTAQTISMLNRIKRDNPLLTVMVFVNELFDYQSPLTRVLMDLCDILVNRYESISGLKRSLVQLGMMKPRRATIMFTRFAGALRLNVSCCDSMFSRLSKRELEIMNYLAQGMSPSEIAEELYISTKTVYTHRLRIYAKLGVKNIIELHRIMQISSII
ncbi:MAG: helix-turn-helix transcriptional regulator [Kluyvera sp.]|uniref:helix-turn-helix transcriptional regulator n=1 Tax=Kluyvera sp. TaxID=1538228 RepID=UPI001411E139